MSLIDQVKTEQAAGQSTTARALRCVGFCCCGCPITGLTGCPITGLTGCPITGLTGCPITGLTGCCCGAPFRRSNLAFVSNVFMSPRVYLLFTSKRSSYTSSSHLSLIFGIPLAPSGSAVQVLQVRFPSGPCVRRPADRPRCCC